MIPTYRKLTDADNYTDPDGAPYEDIVRSIAQYIVDLPDELDSHTYDSDEKGQCFYFPTPGNPHGCIVGWAARQSGLTKLDDSSPAGYFDNAANALVFALDIPGLDADERATDECYDILNFLEDIQEDQDSGASWGLCSLKLKELLDA